MASSRNEQQILWSAASSITLSSATRQVSDAVTLNVEDWDGEIQVYADNQGTPASGDVVDCYIHYTTGDVLGDSGDDYPTNEHAEFLCRLDTFATNTPGEDPASRAVPIRTTAKGFKISVESPNAATRNVVVRARVITHRGQ